MFFFYVHESNIAGKIQPITRQQNSYLYNVISSYRSLFHRVVRLPYGVVSWWVVNVYIHQDLSTNYQKGIHVVGIDYKNIRTESKIFVYKVFTECNYSYVDKANLVASFLA